MKLKENLVISEIGGEYVLVDGSPNVNRFNGMIKLNETSKEIVELLMKETTIDEVATKMMEKYDVDVKIVKDDILKIVESLKQVNLLVDWFK